MDVLVSVVLVSMGSSHTLNSVALSSNPISLCSHEWPQGLAPGQSQKLCPTYVFLSADVTRGLSITTPEQSIDKAKGETAYLPCKFTLGPGDHGPLDIEWLISPSDNQKVDQVVIWICADHCSCQWGCWVCLHIAWRERGEESTQLAAQVW